MAKSNTTNNLNLMQSSTIRITKISEYVDVQKIYIGYSTLTNGWKDFRKSGDIPVRGSGNYASDVLTIESYSVCFYIILGTVSFCTG